MPPKKDQNDGPTVPFIGGHYLVGGMFAVHFVADFFLRLSTFATVNPQLRGRLEWMASKYSLEQRIFVYFQFRGSQPTPNPKGSASPYGLCQGTLARHRPASSTPASSATRQRANRDQSFES